MEETLNNPAKWKPHKQELNLIAKVSFYRDAALSRRGRDTMVIGKSEKAFSLAKLIRLCQVREFYHTDKHMVYFLQNGFLVVVRSPYVATAELNIAESMRIFDSHTFEVTTQFLPERIRLNAISKRKVSWHYVNPHIGDLYNDE